MMYKSRNTYQLKSSEAKTVAKFLIKKFPEQQYTPGQVVDMARPKSSPIHKYFEWDNSVAAEKYRLQQARQLITAIVVVFDDKHEEPQAVSVVAKDVGRTYMNTSKARKIPYIWDQVKNEARIGLLAWARRYKNLSGLDEFKPIFTQIRKVEKNHEKESTKKGRSGKGNSDTKVASKARKDNHSGNLSTHYQ